MEENPSRAVAHAEPFTLADTIRVLPSGSAVKYARPASTGNAEAELDRLARQMQSAERITYAQAYRQVLIQNPRLYTAYLEQHPRQTGGGAHG